MRKDARNLFLLSDMDDTLLSTDKSICLRNREAIERFQRLGGHFSVATGRAPCTASFYLKGIELNAPSILINGGLIYHFDSGQSLFPAYMPPRYRDVVHWAVQNCPQAGIEVITSGGIEVFRYNQVIDRHIGRDGLPYTLRNSSDLPAQAFKVLFGVDQDGMEAFMAQVDAQPHEGLYFVRTNAEYYEMLPVGINKGIALERLRTLLGPDDVLACIGDYYNDAEMLQTADIGIAAGNAPDSIKALARHTVCTNNEGAVADAIDYLLDTSSLY